MTTEKWMDCNAPMADRLFGKCLLVFACAAATSFSLAAPKTPATWTEPMTEAVFVALPKGCFQMGAAKQIPPPWDAQWMRIGYKRSLSEDEVPQHEVCVDAFWMAKTEVTEAAWHKIMGGEAQAGNGQRAKGSVTWQQARRFAERLTELSDGKHRFRLPTEAEWEYACRAGDTRDMEEEAVHLHPKAWYAQSPERSYEVRETGRLQANAFGLHDMLGNVWEWTQDSYRVEAYASHALYNPKIEAEGAPRVIRGGSFRTEFSQTRCGVRGRYDPAETLDSIGLRLVRE